jgi:hypothetical protein
MPSFKLFRKKHAAVKSNDPSQKLQNLGARDILAFIIATYQLFLPLVIALIIAIAIGAVIFIFLF